MKLSLFKSDPKEAWLYLERYVNKGSPSGYTQKYHPPGKFSADSPVKSFELPKYIINKSELITYGQIPTNMDLGNDFGYFFMHPITCQHEDFTKWTGLTKDQLKIDAYYSVSPTASGRTVWVHDIEPLKHLKLHYPGILGRVNRELPFHKAIAGPELWFSLKPLLDSGQAPPQLSFLPEIAARIWYPKNGNINSIGFILRDARPYPIIQNRYVIPFFALFSTDMHAPNDRLLIYQLLDDKHNPSDFLLDYILKPLIETYLFLTLSLGILPEINAQNILLEVETDFTPKRIILRDISRMEKNLDIRRKQGLKTNFIAADYKTIDTNIDKEMVKIRHSFSYDFKLSHYVIGELVDCCAKEYKFDSIRLDNMIKDLFSDLAPPYLMDYFPRDNTWYAHEKILLTGERPYIKHKNPRFRRCKR